MKKIYFIGALLATAMSFGQVALYENFNYTVPGNIGGNTTTTTDATGSNNWVTHSNTSGNAGTIDVLAGNLSYTGLTAPAGNKVYLPGSNTAVPRDVNRAFTPTGTPTVMYYSMLVNIIDNTQLAASPIANTNSYFACFGSASGASNPGIFGGRVAAASVNAGANYRLAIQNNSSGASPTYTELATDLNFGTTYLVVVKLDVTASPYNATMWVNPATLGGAEPAGSVSNNSGTNSTGASFGSIVLRNASATAKVEIDEIRVGHSFADVTPASLAVAQNNIEGLKVYPNPAKNTLYVTSDSFEAKEVQLFDVLGKSVLNTKTVNNTVNISSLSKGVYVVKITEEGKTATRKIVVE